MFKTFENSLYGKEIEMKNDIEQEILNLIVKTNITKVEKLDNGLYVMIIAPSNDDQDDSEYTEEIE